MIFQTADPASPTGRSRGRFWILLALALVVPACGQNKNASPPVVLTISPGLSAAGVPLITQIYIDWDRPLDATTLAGNFTLTDPGGNAPAITISYNSLINEVTLAPQGALMPSTTYTVTILGAVASTHEVPFGGQFWTFTTTASALTGVPTFTGFTSLMATPAVAASVDLTWAAATDAPDNDTVVYDIYVTSQSGGEDYAVGPTVSGVSGTSVTVNAADGLETKVTYFFVIRAREVGTGNIQFNSPESAGVTTN